jgi:hypothetical protein
MPQPLGASFAPTFENARTMRPTGGGAAPSAQALQVLSYNLTPRVAGAPGVSPLQGQKRAGSSMGQAVLESVLKTVLGADAAMDISQGAQSSSPFGTQGPDPGVSGMTGGQIPNPVVHPGGGDGRVRVDDQTGGTSRGTNDPTHAGLQQWLQAEAERRRAMGGGSLPPMFGSQSFGAGQFTGAGGYAAPWMGQR